MAKIDHISFGGTNYEIAPAAGDLRDIVAPEFSDQSSYAAGSYVLKNGVLYRFTSAHAGAWTGTDAVEVTVGGEVEEVRNTLDEVYLKKDWSSGFIDGKFVYTAYSAGDTLDPTDLETNSSYCYIIIPVVAGHTYTLTATTEAGTGKRAFVKTDNQYKVLTFGVNGTSYTNYVIKPSVDGYLIVNAKKAYTHSLTEEYYEVKKIVDDINGLRTDFADNIANWGILDAENYSRNSLAAADGTLLIDSTTRLCTRFIPHESVYKIKPESGYKISIYAYQKDNTYVGVWNGAAFVKTASANNWITDTLDISDFPVDYMFKVLLATTNDDTMSVDGSECVNLKFEFSGVNFDGEKLSVTYDPDSEGKLIDASGVVSAYSGYHYTNLIPIESGVFYSFSFLFSSPSTRYGFRIHAYDANGTWIKQLVYETVGRSYRAVFIAKESSIKYIRVSLKTTMTNLELCAIKNAIYATMNSAPLAEFDAIKYGIAKGSVCLTTSNAVGKCVETYLEHNSNFIYAMFGDSATRGSGQSFIDQTTGKYQIDCSSFAMLVLMGVDYDNSRYNLSNITNKVCALGYGFNPFWGRTFPWETGTHEDTYTWQMCKMFADMGCTADIVNRDFSGVQPGDLIFWGSTTLSTTIGRYKRIRHVDVVIGKVGEKDALLADAGAVPITVHLASARTATDDIAVVARFPLGASPKNDMEVISESVNNESTKTITLTDTYPKYTPFAIKVIVEQTENAGSLITKDDSNNTLYQSDAFNAGMNGKTYAIHGRGFLKASSTDDITITSTGANIKKVVINIPATTIEEW